MKKLLPLLLFVAAPAQAQEPAPEIVSICDHIRYSRELVDMALESAALDDALGQGDLIAYLDLLRIELDVMYDKQCPSEPACIETVVGGTVVCANPEIG